MKIVIYGSVAYDRIMSFSGNFSDHILPEMLHLLNVSFTVDGMKERFGGNAGNIGYALKQLGIDPEIVSNIGKDYQVYFDWLKANDISCDSINIIEDDYTACAYITTDKSGNQITGFNPGALRYPCAYDFNKLDNDSLVIISPGNVPDMMNFVKQCQERKIDYVFDPGQTLPAWQKEDLVSCLTGTKALISNDYELELIMNKTESKREQLLDAVQCLITTFGEKGSRLCFDGSEIDIPVATVPKSIDPTGAGDAYRGGLLFGLCSGKELPEAALLGSVIASFAVECLGTQEYTLNQAEFDKRYSLCHLD